MRPLTHLLLTATVGVASLATPAHAGIYVGVGWPAVVVAPRVVVAPPPVAYVAAPPVYYPRPVYYVPPRFYGPPRCYGAVWADRWHGWHRR